jgi:cytoskeleton protein RodZ
MPTAAHSGSAAEAATGVNGELTAIRRVWVRIITDGDRVERELPEGTRVPLHAQRTLTLRIGDAGAVKMVVDNRDQGALGRDGEVVVRTFTAPAR